MSGTSGSANGAADVRWHLAYAVQGRSVVWEGGADSFFSLAMPLPAGGSAYALPADSWVETLNSDGSLERHALLLDNYSLVVGDSETLALESSLEGWDG